MSRLFHNLRDGISKKEGFLLNSLISQNFNALNIQGTRYLNKKNKIPQWKNKIPQWKNNK